MPAAVPEFAEAPATFEGESVLLRPWDERDLDVLAAAFAIADIAASLRPPVPRGLRGARDWVEARRTMPPRARGAPYAIVALGDVLPVGSVELRVRNAVQGIAEVGYWMLPEGRGRGIAREAVGIACDWALEQPSISSIQAVIDRRNERSQRLVAELGFVPRGQLASNEGWRGDWVVFARERGSAAG